MKNNNLPKRLGWSVAIAMLAVFLVMSVRTSKAEVATGNAQATVVAPVSVHITATPSLSQMVISVEEASQRATAGTPVLRISSAPPSSASASTSAPASDSASPAMTTAAATAKAASSTAVNVTVNSDGSLSVIGPGNGIAFTVTQPASNSVTIEYN